MDRSVMDFTCIICAAKKYKETVARVHGDKSNKMKIVDCCVCGHRQLFPPKYDLDYYEKDEQVNSVIHYYGTKFDTLINHAWIDASRRVQRFFGKINEEFTKKPIKVLDVGGGYGFFGVEFRNTVPSSQVLTIDPSSKRIDIGKHEINKKYPNINPEFLVSLMDRSFVENHKKEFDIVVAWHVLEHIDNPLSFLLMCEDVLKPGGLLCVEVPNLNDDLINLSSSYKDRFYMIEHLSYFDPDHLVNLLSRTTSKGNISISGHQRYGIYNYIHWIEKNKPQGENPDLFDGSDRFWIESYWRSQKESKITTDSIFAWKSKEVHEQTN